MKNILFLFLLSVSIAATAQTEKGSFMIGGNASIDFRRSADEDNLSKTKSFSIDLSPLAGYFVANNLSLGLSMPLSTSTSKSTYRDFYPEYETSSNGIGIAPFIRYYIPVKSFFIVTEAAYSFTYSKNIYDSIDPVTGEVIGNDEFTNKSNAIRLAAGPTFFISKNTSIEILANYEHTTFDNANSVKYKTSNFYVSAGFQIYIPKNRE